MSPRETTLSLTSTIIKRIALLMASFAILASFALAQGASANQGGQRTLQQEVKHLGLPGNDDFADVKRLARTPSASAGFLVSELHVLEHPERTIVGDENAYIGHVLWSIRALRYITGGKDFCAPTKWKAGSAYEEGIRSYWLHFSSKRCVTFFATWPSRGRTYIAPEDAQKEIIAKWKRWFAAKGASFDYKPLRHPKPEQWLE